METINDRIVNFIFYSKLKSTIYFSFVLFLVLDSTDIRHRHIMVQVLAKCLILDQQFDQMFHWKLNWGEIGKKYAEMLNTCVCQITQRNMKSKKSVESGDKLSKIMLLKNQIFLRLKLKSMGGKLIKSGSKEKIPLSCSGEKFNICGRHYAALQRQKCSSQNHRNTYCREIKHFSLLVYREQNICSSWI